MAVMHIEIAQGRDARCGFAFLAMCTPNESRAQEYLGICVCRGGVPCNPSWGGGDETVPSFDPEDEGGCPPKADRVGWLLRGLVNRIRLHFGLLRSLS